MDNAPLLVAAMAEKCRSRIQASHDAGRDLPKPLRAEHLMWMCKRIEENFEAWPLSKLHRWIGFVQCAIIANGILDLQGVKAMFDDAKVAHGQSGEDLLDHLDVASDFEVDLGGEG